MKSTYRFWKIEQINQNSIEIYENDDDRESCLIEFQYCILDRVIEFLDYWIFCSNFHRRFFEIERLFRFDFQ